MSSVEYVVLSSAVNNTFKVARSTGKSLMSVRLHKSLKSGSSNCKMNCPLRLRLVHNTWYSSSTLEGLSSTERSLISCSDTMTRSSIVNCFDLKMEKNTHCKYKYSA